MTIVNTVPPFHIAGATAAAVVSGAHTALVLPEVFAQPISESDWRLREILMPATLVLDVTIDVRDVCIARDARRGCAGERRIDSAHRLRVAYDVATSTLPCCVSALCRSAWRTARRCHELGKCTAPGGE